MFLAANYMGWRANPGFYGFEPNPYCFIILLMASRYGAFAGLFSAGCVISILGAMTCFFVSPDILKDVYFIKCFFIFLFIGYLIGEIRQKYIKVYQQLEASFEKEQQTGEVLKKENNRIKKINKEMGDRILDDVSSFASLYETSKHLQSFDVEEIYKAVLDIIVQHLEVDACSVFLIEGDNLVLRERRGDEQMDVIPMPFDDGMITRAVKDARVYSVRDYLTGRGDLSFKKDGTIMAAPLINTSGEVFGALSIEKMPFMRITNSSEKVFALLAEWVSTDIENALYFQDVKRKNILDEALNVYTHDYLLHRMDQEFYRANRYKISLSLCIIKIKEFEEMDVSKQLKILKMLASGLNKCLRLTDIVTQYQDTVPFAIIFTTTDYDQAILAMNRVMGMLGSLGLDTMNDGHPLEIEYGIGAYDGNIESKEELFFLAEEDLSKWNINVLSRK